MTKIKSIILMLILLVCSSTIISCSCIECTYYRAKSSIVTFVSSFYVPPEGEIIDLIKEFAIRNPKVDWSFIVDSSKNISFDKLKDVQIFKLDDVLIEGIGWYEKNQEIEYWPVETEIKGEFSLNPNDQKSSDTDNFETTLVIFLYKNKSEKWAFTHTKHEPQHGMKLTPIYKP